MCHIHFVFAVASFVTFFSINQWTEVCCLTTITLSRVDDVIVIRLC